jgi:putative aldouronate transport system substrate-binding protein
MKKAKLFFMILMAFTLLVTACSSGSDNSGTSSNEGTENTADGAQGLEPYELVLAFPVFADQKDMQLVQDELNKITKEKINTTVKFQPNGFGAYIQQMPLMLAGSEKLDLLATGLGQGQYNAQVAKGQLQPLNELLEKHGQGIKQALIDQDPAYLEATYVAGESYGVPSIRDLASDFGFIMRKDLAEKHGIDVAAIKNLDDVEAALKIMKEKEPEMTLAKSTDTTTGLYFERVWDNLGDNLGVVMMNDSSLKVVNGYETAEYKDVVTKLHNWYNAGYIAKDVATNTTIAGHPDVKAGIAYGYLSHMKPGYEAQETKATGYEMVATRIMPPITATGNVTVIMWSIAHQSENPERAMMFLDLMYTDPAVVNLFDWGIEGKHYAKVEGSDNVIDYPQGVDASTSGYQLGMGWMFGNQLISHVWNGDDPDIWNKLSEFNKTAMKSPAMGFSFVADSVKTEIAAVTNVLNQYRIAFETGSVSPDKIPEFNAALKAAGLDIIIAEKQKQLDAWKASKQ